MEGKLCEMQLNTTPVCCDLMSCLKARLDVLNAYLSAGKVEEAINTCYTDDCRHITTKHVLQGRKALREDYVKNFKAGGECVCQLDEVNGDGQWAWARGCCKCGNQACVTCCRCLMVFKKVDGEFRIHIDTRLV